MSNYIKKYKKYKLKYLNFKKQQKVMTGGTNYKYLTKFGSMGIGDGQFSGPAELAILANGDIAVSEMFNHRVQIFDSNGIFKTKFGSQGTGNGEFNFPFGLVELSNRDIAVCDKNNNRVQIFDSNGIFKSKFGSEGTGDGQFGKPRGINVLTNGDIVVSEMFNHRVQIFDSNGIFKSKFGSHGTGNGEFNLPAGIAIFTNGDIAVCDVINNRVQIFDSNGIFKSKFGSEGSENGQFRFPVGIIELSNGNIAVQDGFNRCIQIFNSNEEDGEDDGEDEEGEEGEGEEGEEGEEDGEDDGEEGEGEEGEEGEDDGEEGEFQIRSNLDNYLSPSVNYKYLRKFGSRGYRDGQFNGPSGITTLSNGDIAISDDDKNCVQIFDSNGVFKSKFGSFGNGDGEFDCPMCLDVFDNGYFAVCDMDNHRVQIFDSNGIFKSKFGSKGTGDGQFMNPVGIAILSNQDIVVSDNLNHRVQIFDPNGIFKSKFGSHGTGNGEFNDPCDITIIDENILISDTKNHRVQIFDANGVFKSTFGSQGTGDGQFNSPQGIAILPNKDIAVCDSKNHRVQIFDPNGIFKSKFGSHGTGNGEFNDPNEISVLPNGNIIVTDYHNDRVQIFTINEDEYEDEDENKDENIKRLVSNDISIKKFDLNLLAKLIVEELKSINPVINDYLNNFKITIKLHEDILEQISKIPKILENRYQIKFIIEAEEIGIDAGGITRKVLSNINTNSRFFIVNENYKILNKYNTKYEMEVLGYFWAYVIKINEALPAFLHPLMLLFLTTSWDNYLSIFKNFDTLEYFLNSFDTQIIKSYMKNYNFPDNELFIQTYKEDEFWDVSLKQADIECLLRKSVKTSQGKIEILLQKMKYDYAISLRNNLETFKTSFFKYLGKDISNIGIELMTRILSGDPDITWEKILPFFQITSTIGLDNVENKKLILGVIESEVKSHQDYPKKLFEALTGARIMSSSYSSKLELKLNEVLSDSLTNYHTCFGWVDINLPENFNRLSQTEKKKLIIIAIGYDAISNEIKSKVNQLGGNIVIY